MADKNFEINTAKRMSALELPLVTILAVFTPTSIDPPSNLALPAHVTHGPTAGKQRPAPKEKRLPLSLVCVGGVILSTWQKQPNFRDKMMS